MVASAARRPVVLALAFSLAGAAVAGILGLLTFGAQASVRPDHLPVAVSVPAQAPVELRTAAERVAGQGGDAVSWRVTTPDEARTMLADKEIYGVLELASHDNGLAMTIVVSGAVNPQGTQSAQQILTGAAQGLTAAITQAAPGVEVAPVQTVTLHQASLAARTAPLAASALLWIGGLVAAAMFGLLIVRKGQPVGTAARAVLATAVSVLAVAVVAGLIKLWDAGLPMGADVLGFLLLAAIAFAAVQGALLRLLRIRALALLGPLYLIAPAVAGAVPEMLNPTYRALLWSWTPFRFSTEGLRSLLQGTPSAPDVRTGIIVLAAMAVVGLVILLWPSRRGAEPSAAEVAEPDVPDHVVDVGVDQADRLPGAERDLAVQHGNAGGRRDQRG